MTGRQGWAQYGLSQLLAIRWSEGRGEWSGTESPVAGVPGRQREGCCC